MSRAVKRQRLLQNQQQMMNPMMMMPQMGMMPNMMGMMAPQMAQPMESESEEELQNAVPAAAAAAPVPAAAGANPAAAVDAAPSGSAVPPAPAVVPVDDMPCGYDKGPNAEVGRRGTTVRGMPRCRLVACVVQLGLSSDIDAGYLSELSQFGLSMMLWIFTRIRPATKISNLSLWVANRQ